MRERVKPRRYDSRGRREQADRTRTAVLDAAERLFQDKGYAKTTIAAVADAAGVSVETIYKGFGGKAGLVQGIYARGLAGSGPAPAARRSDAMQSSAEDAAAVIRAWGALQAEVAPRAAPMALLIRSAAGTDPEMASLLHEIDAARLKRMEQNARRLLELPGARRGLAVAEARDVLWTYSSADLYDLLVVRRGWSLDRFQEFSVRGMSAALLEENPR
jgi:AcrR family transcriptional regulator